MKTKYRPFQFESALSYFSFFILILGSTAQAGLYFDQSLGYYTNSISTSGSDSMSHYHASFALSSRMSKDFFLGWKTTYYNESQASATGTAKMNGLELGPRLGMFFGKSHWMSFNIAYLPLHSATYTSATGVASKMSGSGYDFELAFHPDAFRSLSPGFSLMYHMGTYSSSTDASNLTTTVSYKRNGFYPSLYLHWKLGED